MASSKNSTTTEQYAEQNAMHAPLATEANALTKAPGALAPLEYDESDLGSGFEDVTAKDFVIPFVRPLQKLSPQVDEDNSAHIPGAKAGSFLNTATNEIIDGKAGFVFIPVHRTHQFLEFIPRDQGGGFVAVHQPTDADVLAAIRANGNNDRGKVPFGDGNELIESFAFYGHKVNDDGTVEPIVVPFTSSQIGVYKSMITMMNMQQVQTAQGKKPKPMFSNRFVLRTRFKENKKGSWHLMVAEWFGGNAQAANLPQDHPLFQQAKAFRALVTGGQVQADYRASGAGDEAASDGGEIGADVQDTF